MGNDRALLAQIRKSFSPVIVVVQAGTVEGGEVGGRKSCGSDRQRNRLVEPLLACKADTTPGSLIGMFIAKTPPAFYTLAQRRVLTPMRN